MNSAAAQYMPFFLTGFFPCFLVLVGMWMNNRRHDRTDADLADLKSWIRIELADLKGLTQHFIDLHIGHEGRLSTVEERTKQK
jgi:hypothetical protein